ncbi:MAG TPA: UDP-N-acetylmuramoyl-L-alanyl-D-glutamate--2,6-diaminopimelate ligase, partial [Gammaproteobacteria bacterium]|nr:UDP-N-acetylmuramoyl-L-alanyl-D-glutamate--2,6-diaminopimelate ligase [Gammaproteobacteria bacterium]
PWRVVHDRAQAIVTAIGLGGPGDVVLVAGKGHERYQEVGNSRQPFSDAEVVADVLGAAA